jgi:hypothetical protein
MQTVQFRVLRHWRLPLHVVCCRSAGIASGVILHRPAVIWAPLAMKKEHYLSLSWLLAKVLLQQQQ